MHYFSPQRQELVQDTKTYPTLSLITMKAVHSLLALALLALAFSSAFAYDPSPLQDFCVAVNSSDSGVFVNGRLCKNPDLVTPDDFLFRGINIPRPTNNQVGSTVTNVNVDNLPGLNTMGVSIARIDYGPGGLNPPHIHPRATEMLTCMQGTLLVGFITSNPNKLFSRVLNAGDIFVFPFGMIHFQLNVGKGRAFAISSLSSQNPGVITVANALFGSNPPVDPRVLTRAFQLDEKVVKELLKKFADSNSNY